MVRRIDSDCTHATHPVAAPRWQPCCRTCCFWALCKVPSCRKRPRSVSSSGRSGPVLGGTNVQGRSYTTRIEARLTMRRAHIAGIHVECADWLFGWATYGALTRFGARHEQLTDKFPGQQTAPQSLTNGSGSILAFDLRNPICSGERGLGQ